MHRPSILSDEQGVATVIVVMSIPFFILFCALAIDVANWFVHKRHLQTQADAAALAGGGLFSFPTCVNSQITNAALRYSGKGDGTQTWNLPSDVKTPQSRLHAEINQRNYYNQSTPGETDLPATPCNAKFIDVKMTETDLPWFWGAKLVPHINAQARVKLFQATLADKLLPIGVQEASPKRVRAFVVDEATGTPLPNASVILTDRGASGGLQRFSNDTPMSFDVPEGTSDHLGLRLALSGSDTSSTCGDALVSCYDSSDATKGLSHIRTWTDQPVSLASPAAPIARSVYLSPGTCGNASFSSNATQCTMDVSAKVSWNSDVTAAALDPATSKTKLTVTYNGNSYAMTYTPANGTWTRTGVPVPAGTIGSTWVSIDWEQQLGKVSSDTCTTTGGNKCKGTFTNVQRTFWNDPTSQSSQAGPVAQLDVLDSATTQQVSDLRRCSTCTASLTVDVGIKGALVLGAQNDPPVSLRVNGNQTQSLQCDPGEGGSSGLINMLANGCGPQYGFNTGESCPQKQVLWARAQPWTCVALRTGDPPNATPKGLNLRILCNTAIDGPAAADNCTSNGSANVCTHPNRWPNWDTGGTRDPRIVDVFITPYGTFTGTGNDETVPVIKVGSFYITGYTGQGGVQTPCGAVTGANADTYSINPPPAGNISGHFLVTTNPNSGNAGNETCDTTQIGICVAVLVK